MTRRRSFGEFDGIEVLKLHLGANAKGAALVGIGDDAAVLPRPAGDLVVSVDASLEGVHFDLSWLSLSQAATRSFHAAVSDLAAMGATPLVAVCALELPRGAARKQLAAIGQGQAKAARELECPIVGGNVTRGTCFGFTTTVLGTSRRDKPSPLRSGAKPGDEVWLSHEAGWAGLGLHLLQRGLAKPSRRGFSFAPNLGKWTTRAVDAWVQPRAKLREGQVWRPRVHSLIDTSDSVASEVRHIASASDVRIVLDATLVLGCHQAVQEAARELGLEPLPVVLYGGEDYALLGTGPANKRPPGALLMGHVEKGQGAVLTSDGKHQPLESGFDHLRVRS